MTSSPRRYRDGHFTRDGLRLHYRDYPGPREGPPLLCLPGLTRNARDFADFAERMSPRFRVLALDFRGRGASNHDPQPERYLPVTYAHDTIALLDHVGVADAVFVGTSLGGIVTMLVAVLDGDRIAAAILNDVGPELSQSGIDRIRDFVGRDAAGFANWGEAAAAIRSNQVGLPADWGPRDWERVARQMCSEKEDGRVYFDYDPAIAIPFAASPSGEPVDMWPLFDALARKPVLVVRGEHSDLITAAAAATMKERSANAAVVTIPGAGHAPTLAEPEAVAAIDAFLSSLSEPTVSA